MICQICVAQGFGDEAKYEVKVFNRKTQVIPIQLCAIHAQPWIDASYEYKLIGGVDNASL